VEANFSKKVTMGTQRFQMLAFDTTFAAKTLHPRRKVSTKHALVMLKTPTGSEGWHSRFPISKF